MVDAPLGRRQDARLNETAPRRGNILMKFSIYKDRAGEYRWRLVATNGRTIADSAEGYRSKADCGAGIQLVKTGAPSAQINDETTAPSAYGR
jgi:hypothetical protein